MPHDQYVTALSRLIAAAMDEQELSTRDVAQASGGAFGHATVGKYRKGQEPRRPNDNILRAFSSVLGIPLPALYRAAGVTEPLEDWVPPPEAHRMTQRQRDAITEIIKLLVNAQEHQAPQPVPGPRDSDTTPVNAHLRAWRAEEAENTPAHPAETNPAS